MKPTATKAAAATPSAGAPSRNSGCAILTTVAPISPAAAAATPGQHALQRIDVAIAPVERAER